MKKEAEETCQAKSQIIRQEECQGEGTRRAEGQAFFQSKRHDECRGRGRD
jgi:hypothetical protein